MTTHKRDTSLGTGVYFAKGDYIGITRRMVILAVDVFVLALGFTLIDVLYREVARRYPPDMVVWSYLGFVWVYLTLFKASRVRTIGFRVMGARIVTLRGERPSILRMTFRLMLWLFGPFNVIYDLFWAGTGDDRQTLRDRFAGTCVVKNSAEPIGTGEIHFAHYNAFGLNLMYPRVTQLSNSSPGKVTETSKSP